MIEETLFANNFQIESSCSWNCQKYFRSPATLFPLWAPEKNNYLTLRIKQDDTLFCYKMFITIDIVENCIAYLQVINKNI